MQPSLNASLSRLLIENKHGRINNSLLQSFCIMNDWRDLSICIMRCYSIAGLSPSSNAWRSLNREKLDLQRIWIFPLPPRCYDFYAPCDTECIFQAWMEEVINKASVYLGGRGLGLLCCTGNGAFLWLLLKCIFPLQKFPHVLQ